MVSMNFGESLSKIRSLPLGNLDEQATKLGAILPLLRQVGWDTENPTEVRPDRKRGKSPRSPGLERINGWGVVCKAVPHCFVG